MYLSAAADNELCYLLLINDDVLVLWLAIFIIPYFVAANGIY